jgi:hypothetical protein
MGDAGQGMRPDIAPAHQIVALDGDNLGNILLNVISYKFLNLDQGMFVKINRLFRKKIQYQTINLRR